MTTIRALLTPQPLRELRVKADYIHHPRLEAAMGVKIAANELERAIAGTSVMVVGPDDDIEDLKEEAQQEVQAIMDSIKRESRGVYVTASTLGASRRCSSSSPTAVTRPFRSTRCRSGPYSRMT